MKEEKNIVLKMDKDYFNDIVIIKSEIYQTFHDALYEGIGINTEGAYNYRFRE